MILENVIWQEYKNYIDSNGIITQYVESENKYTLYAINGSFALKASIKKDSGAEQVDFETNYKPNANKKLGMTTEYTSVYSAKNDACQGIVPPGATQNIDFKIVNYGSESYAYKYLKGGIIFGSNFEYGDYAKFQIVDKDGVYYPAGSVLKEYIVKRFLHPTDPSGNKIKAQSPGEVPVNTYLRCIFTAGSSGSDRTVYINYDLQNKG